MYVRHRLTTVLTVRIVLVHVGRHGTGPVERDKGGDIVERVGHEGAHQRPHRAAFELEHPDRVSPAQGGEGVGIVEGDTVDVGPRPLGESDEIEGPLDDRQVPQAQKVHFEQAQLLHAVHLVLGDDGGLGDRLSALGLALHGEVLGEGVLRDHDGGGMDAVLASEPFESLGHVDDTARLGILRVHVAQLPGGGEAVVLSLDPVEARPQGRIAAHDERRHRLGDAVPDDVRQPENPRCVAHGGPGLDGRERHDLRHPVVAVALGRVFDHLAAIALVEVHVDIGHLLATRIEEALEEQVVANRVEVDDLQAVGHAATGRRTAPGTDSDATRPGEADEVPHDEEVGRETHVGDDTELIVEPFLHGGRQGAAVTLVCSLEGQMAQVGVGPLLVVRAFEFSRNRELRERVQAELDLDARPLGNEQRVVARLGNFGEQTPHLDRGLEVMLLAFEFEPLRVVDESPGLHTEQCVVSHGIFPMRVMTVVGGDQRCIQLPRDPDESRIGATLCGQPVVLDLHEQAVAPEDVLKPAGELEGLLVVAGQKSLQDHATEASGGGDETGAVLLEELPIDTGLVVVTLEVGGRRQLHQVAVALGRLGQKSQVVIELVPPFDITAGVVDLAPSHRPFVTGFARHVRLGADHRRDALLPALGVEVEHPVHVAVIGNADRRLPVGHRRLDQVADAGRAIEHRVLGVGVQMGERSLAGHAPSPPYDGRRGVSTGELQRWDLTDPIKPP